MDKCAPDESDVVFVDVPDTDHSCVHWQVVCKSIALCLNHRCLLLAWFPAGYRYKLPRHHEAIHQHIYCICLNTLCLCTMVVTYADSHQGFLPVHGILVCSDHSVLPQRWLCTGTDLRSALPPHLCVSHTVRPAEIRLGHSYKLWEYEILYSIRKMLVWKQLSARQSWLQRFGRCLFQI